MYSKGMKMAVDVCRTAVKSQQDKDHPDDPDWMMYLIKKEATRNKLDSELRATEMTVAGIVEDKEAAQALLDEVSKSEITGIPGGKAKTTAKAITITPIGTPVPNNVGG